MYHWVEILPQPKGYVLVKIKQLVHWINVSLSQPPLPKSGRTLTPQNINEKLYKNLSTKSDERGSETRFYCNVVRKENNKTQYCDRQTLIQLE